MVMTHDCRNLVRHLERRVIESTIHLESVEYNSNKNHKPHAYKKNVLKSHLTGI